MSYRDPYTSEPTYKDDGNQGYSNQGHTYGMNDRSQDLYQQSWNRTQGNSGAHSGRTSHRPYDQRKNSIETRSGDTNYNYPPLRPNRPIAEKNPDVFKRTQTSVEIVTPAVPVGERSHKAVGSSTGGFGGVFTNKKRTPSAYREYRYNHQGNLWTKGGPLRTTGRFCVCVILITLLLLFSIVLSLVLWLRPPNVRIGDVQTNSGSGNVLQTSTGGGFQVNLSTVISVDNFNYFDVDMKKIQVEVYYPINNTPVGGGVANDVFFKSGMQTNFTFPFSLTYNPLSDGSGQVLADFAKKCGALGGQRTNLSVNYKLSLVIQLLMFRVSPVISNVFTFPCPINPSDISKIFGSS